MLIKFFITHIFIKFVIYNIFYYNHRYDNVNISYKEIIKLYVIIKLYYIQKTLI